MANKDLRNFLDEIEKIGELKNITGAETEEDIGGIVDMYMRDLNNPAVLFDEVPGFPKGHRVLANIIMSRPRCAIALGLPPESTEEDLIKWWRHYLGDAQNHEPVEVNGGPLVENVTEGEAVNIQGLPAPKWHEHDGGNFIGTGCIVAMESTIAYNIERAGNLKSSFFGGEGLFLATLSGTGRVWLQSLPFERLAARVARSVGTGGSGGDQSGFNINFG